MFELAKAIHEAIHTESTAAFMVTIAVVFALLGTGVGWIVDRQYKNTLAEKQMIKAVSLDCRMAALPVPFPSNSTIYYMELREALRSSLSEIISSAADADTVWPNLPSDNKGLFAYSCKVTNYGDDPIFALSMVFKVTFLETTQTTEKLQGHYGLISGKPTSSYDHSVSVRTLEPKNGEFTFYIYNTSQQFVRVETPSEATYEPAAKTIRVKVPLKLVSSGGNFMTFSPMPLQEPHKK